MPNPKAPTRTVRTVESVDVLDHFLGRLTSLGATADELDTVRSTWDDFDDDWTPVDRANLVAASDADLRRQLEGLRSEYRFHTSTDADDAAVTAARTEVRLAEEAALVVDRAANVAEVLGWVDDDPAKAGAVLAVERDGKARKTLIAELERIVG